MEKKSKKRKIREQEFSRNQESEIPGCQYSEYGSKDVVKVPEKKNTWSSWSEAFNAAASIQPVELDEEFLRRRITGDHEDEEEDTNSREQEDKIGARKVSQLASDYFQIRPSSFAASPSLHHDSKDPDTNSTHKVKDKKRKKKRLKGDRTLKQDKPDVSLNYSQEVASLPTDPITDFPFPANSDDHCETPEEAYSDIVPFLKAMSTYLKKSSIETVIYDPYYCSGSVVKHLSLFGFSEVLNLKHDCYSVWNSSGMYPSYDIFLTNPPYSLDHIERLIQHLTSKLSLHKSRPFFLLLPTWVHKKDYYLDALATSSIQPFYLVPKKRYVYKPPPGFREKKSSDVHKKNSPFVSMWYIWGGTHEMTEKLIRVYSTSNISERCDVARTKSALRDLRRKNK